MAKVSWQCLDWYVYEEKTEYNLVKQVFNRLGLDLPVADTSGCLLIEEVYKIVTDGIQKRQAQSIYSSKILYGKNCGIVLEAAYIKFLNQASIIISLSEHQMSVLLGK